MISIVISNAMRSSILTSQIVPHSVQHGLTMLGFLFQVGIRFFQDGQVGFGIQMRWHLIQEVPGGIDSNCGLVSRKT